MKRKREVFADIAVNFVFIILCILALLPVWYIAVLSLSGGSGALSGSISLFPRNPTFANYRNLLVEEPFLRWFINSAILSIGTMIIAMGSSILAAYAFSRFRFAGRNMALWILLVLNAFPQLLTMFAIFRLFKSMGLLNSYIGLILIYSGSMCIFSIWNMKGYFDSIPIDMEEAAKIDGASDTQVIFKIMLPLARPTIIVTAVMVLIFVWNEYLFSTTFMLNESNYTLAGGLYALQSNDYSRSWPMFCSAAILVSIPVLIIFFCIQKYMVSGLTAGGVKG